MAVDYDGAKTRFFLDGVLIQESDRDLVTDSGGFSMGSNNTPNRFGEVSSMK